MDGNAIKKKPTSKKMIQGWTKSRFPNADHKFFWATIIFFC